jgi:protease-4
MAELCEYFCRFCKSLSLAIVLAFATFALTACGPATFVVGVAPGGQALQSTVIQSDSRWGSPRIAVIDVSGVLSNTDRQGLLSTGLNPVAAFTEQLAAAAIDPQVKAVVLRINSPGGSVTATDMMYRELLRFREQTGKPVIAMMMDVAASGGYYLACGADEIVAYPTTLTASIGVLLQTVSLKPALQRIGIETETLVSGSNKAAGSPFETLSEDQRKLLQNIVDDYAASFKSIVREARPSIPADRFDTLTDGRVMTGSDALQAGLVDRVGDLRDAFTLAFQAAGFERGDVIKYHRPLDYVASPYATTPSGNPSTQINLIQIDASDLLDQLGTRVGAYYLWQPELP